MIIGLALYVWNDILLHRWEDGFRIGYAAGYEAGLIQPPQVWKSGS